MTSVVDAVFSNDERVQEKRTPRSTSKLSLFLRASVFDFALVLLVSLGLLYAVLSGFVSTLPLRGDVAVQAGIASVLLVVLFAGSWSKRAMAVSAVITVVICAVVLGVCLACTPAGLDVVGHGGVNDVEGNYAVFGVAVVVVPLAVFLLSRRPVGALALLVVSVVVCASIQFLYRDWLSSEGGLVAAGFVLAGTLALIVYQGYRQSAYDVERFKTPAFGKAFCFSLLLALVCVLAGGGLFYGVVDALQLSTPIIKPFERHIIRPVVEYSGVYDNMQVENPDMLSSLVSEEEDESNQDAEGGSDPQQDEETAGATMPLLDLIQSIALYDQDDWNTGFQAISYNFFNFTTLLVVFAIVMLVACAIALRIRWRTVRLKRLEGRSYGERVEWLYGFLMNRFGRLGIERDESLTPLEFAFATRQMLVPFSRGTGKVDFVRVTLLYQRAAYGSRPLGEDEYRAVERYYKALFKNAHRFVGGVKWLWKFWRI